MLENEDKSNSILLDELPIDTLILVFKNLSYNELISVSQVNKRLNSLVNDNLLWKQKFVEDMNKWKMVDSQTWPKWINEKDFESKLDENISYKKSYLECCPELLTQKDILKKIKAFNQIQNSLHATSTSESINSNILTNNLTLSSLSPIMIIDHIKEFVNRNVLRNFLPKDDYLPKLVMFGPGLETSTSCLVTNILWKSEFKTIGMIPGKDGYGSGIKLKLFNHRPFNLTILYTNVGSVRSNKDTRTLNKNKLIFNSSSNDSNEITYEINPQVKEAISDADGFVYVIDNDLLSSSSGESEIYENYKTELNVLMQEAKKDLSVLILSCKTNSNQEINKKSKDGLSCAKIVNLLQLYKLDRKWQMRNCQIFQEKMKDIVLGFEWILNELDQKFLMERINSQEF